MHTWLGIFVIGLGLANYALYYYRVDWWMNHPKTQRGLNLFGEKGYTIFITIFTLFSIVVGLLIIFGYM